MVVNTRSDLYKSRPKKRLGQHFLTSSYHATRIAEAIPANTTDNVLEIGPGEGALSIHLISRFPSLHLVEFDRDVIPRLRNRLGQGSWTLHRCNVLDLDFTAIGSPLHVVGNLPYNIGAHIIKKVLLYGSRTASCTFMVQREVAERIVSGSHTRTNGFLSIFCQFFGTPNILFHVPPGAFFPKPNVESSVFQIRVNDPESRLSPDKWQEFFAFVDRGFCMRRKQLAKILGYQDGRKQVFRQMLEELGLSSSARPEELTVTDWVSLFKRVNS
ncbi:MAG: 16S rRNA (adenine(1518)-N(6)/adenine(1519)-N(6))-dimethyltransferase RsmA [Fibrobacterota bacterium]